MNYNSFYYRIILGKRREAVQLPPNNTVIERDEKIVKEFEAHHWHVKRQVPSGSKEHASTEYNRPDSRLHNV
jgi:hypothetical protein